MADTFTLYKLIILYLLDKVNFPMSNAQLSEFILEKEYTDYFTVQTALSELSETGFLRVKTVRNTSLYRITEEGRKTLSYFIQKISPAIREEIDSFLQEHSYELRNEISTPADYYKTDSGEFAAPLPCSGKGFRADRPDTDRSRKGAGRSHLQPLER